MSDAPRPTSEDVALVYGTTDDGGARILRARQGRLEAGEVRPAVDGKPLLGRELVKLHARADAPQVCDVEVIHPAETAQQPEPGRPAVVASDQYRANWDRIFGSRSTPAGAPN